MKFYDYLKTLKINNTYRIFIKNYNKIHLIRDFNFIHPLYHKNSFCFPVFRLYFKIQSLFEFKLW